MNPEKEKQQMQGGKGVKQVVLVIAERYRDEEYHIPLKILEDGGIKVITAANVCGEINGKISAKAISQRLLKEINHTEFDALIFIGGPGAKTYFDDQIAHNLLREFQRADKIYGAICIAPVTLAKAGVLQGVRATVFPDGIPELQKAGATYEELPVVVDGKVITGNGPTAAQEFGECLLQLLGE